MDRQELALEFDLGRNSRVCLRQGWTSCNGPGAGSGKEFSRLPAERMYTGWNGPGTGSGTEFSRLAAERMYTGWNGPGAGSGKEFSRLAAERTYTGWHGAWSWIWERILEAACGEDGQAGTGPGAGSGKEFSRRPAERMDRLARGLELDLGRNSRGCLRRGWTCWHGAWFWIWERILEAACGEDGQAGTGSGAVEVARGEDGQAGTGPGAGAGEEFLRLPAEMMDRLERGPGAGSGKEFSRLLWCGF